MRHVAFPGGGLWVAFNPSALHGGGRMNSPIVSMEGGGVGASEARSRLEVLNSSGYVANREKCAIRNNDNEKITVIKARCRSFLCPTCGPWLGRVLRHRLLASSAQWVEPIMITFTVGRSDYGNHSPLQAYNRIMKKRYISRMMKLLGITRWVSILEPQGDGFPHWHVLADGEGRRLDYRLLRRVWRDVWKLGNQVDVKRDWCDSAKAINYITKYLIKRADKYAPWMYRLARIRIVQGSKLVGPLTGDGRGRKEATKAIADHAAPIVGRRIPAVRVAQCGAVLVHVERDHDTGAIKAIERVAIIPEKRFYDLSGIHSAPHPVTGVRSLAMTRSEWDAMAEAWRVPAIRSKWMNWVAARACEYLSPPAGRPASSSAVPGLPLVPLPSPLES